ncbi:hypothetical protein [Corynebacterium nuruki]|uniref:Aromatic ring-opening dioxygenase LigA n=1 Tax=Corynebacterium nuruki TaxID=1032851 RepID=A0A3D4SYV3_9CORY|nr:hypothetical protein [Corynebacterium nuruki]HCT14454.1 hypothetical protein [Corynebacterium nuruki]
MSTNRTRNLRTTRRAGRAVSALGAGFLTAAAGSWVLIRKELLAENITVHDDVKKLAGKKVADPFTAYAQADIVNKHALAMTGGKPFAELPMDAPERQTALMAANVRSSLLTSVLSFGLSGLTAGVGVTALLAGRGLKSAAKGE